MGLCYNIAFVFSYEKIYPEKCDIVAIFEIIDIEEKERSMKYVVKTIENKNIKKSANTKLILYTEKNNIYNIGDIIKVYGEFKKANSSRNYKGFNYRNYLKQKKIYGIINSEKIEFISKKTSFNSTIGNLRELLKRKIDYLYSSEYSNFLKGILLGKTNSLDEEVVESFRKVSISHILAISGLHVSYVVLGLKGILSKLIKSVKKQNIIIITILFCFSFFTGFSPSCIRACIMNSINLINFNLNKRNNIYKNILISFIIIIFLNPFNIYSVGMWLSFLATLSIILFYRMFYRICELYLKNVVYKKIYLKILKVVLITISAQILTFPISIYVFNTININIIISNFLISFLIGPILALGYLSIFISFIKNPFTKVLSYIEKILIYVLLNSSKILSQIPFSRIYVKTPYFISILIFYVIVFIIIIVYLKRKYMILRIILFPIRALKNNYKKIKIIIVFLVISITLLTVLNTEKLEVHFIDVGQGDSTLIITPEGKKILVDGGEGNSNKYDYGKNVLLPYLLDRRINKIDYLIISHADSDHIGGTFSVLESLKVNKILIGVQPENSNQLTDLIEKARKKKIEIIILKAGDNLKIEEDIYLHTIWPNANNILRENSLNNNSLVFKLELKNTSILFTGDIEEIAEKEILSYYENTNALKSTILKVAHHGSKTSSSKDFLDAVNPEIALIGVGGDNSFGHPGEEVIKRLKEGGIKVFRTDECGEISIKFDEKMNIKSLFLHTRNR